MWPVFPPDHDHHSLTALVKKAMEACDPWAISLPLRMPRSRRIRITCFTSLVGRTSGWSSTLSIRPLHERLGLHQNVVRTLGALILIYLLGDVKGQGRHALPRAVVLDLHVCNHEDERLPTLVDILTLVADV